MERKGSSNMLRIDSTWLHTIRPGQWTESVLESALLVQLIRNSVDVCPLSGLNQNSMEAADTGHQSNACSA